MNLVVAMMQDYIAVVFKSLSKLADYPVVYDPGEGSPFLHSLLTPGAGPVAPEMFEFVLEDEHCIDDFAKAQQFLHTLPLFGPIDIPRFFLKRSFVPLKTALLALEAFRYTLLGALSITC